MQALAMGGYGFYVWTCFAITFIVLIGNEWRARARQKAVYRDIEVRIRAVEERTMKARQQRMLTVGLAAAGLIVAAALTLTAFRENMMFFVGVSDVVAGEYPRESTFRVGGLVVDGSVQRQSGFPADEFSASPI